MQNDPWVQIPMLGVGLCVAKLWLDDFRARRTTQPNSRALPGTTSAPLRAVIVGAVGGLLIVGAETWGEKALGLTGQQSTITGLFAVYTLIAAVVEEIIFRGFLVVEKRGKSVLWLSVFAASLIFTAIHPFLWHWDGGPPWTGGRFLWTVGTKGWFSTGAVFLSSLWFYFVRFARFNPEHSLLPCFAAHASKNASVILIKAAQGFLVGWW